MAIQPYHDRDGFIYMDGQLVPWRDAKVHYLTHALHYGTCVFEGERAYNGKIFKSKDHTQRLFRSAEIIRMDMSAFDADTINAAKEEVLKANNLTNAYIRVAAWRGSEQMGIDISKTVTHLAIAAWDWGKYFDPSVAEKGISLMTSPWVRPAPNMAPIHSKAASNYNMGCIAKSEATDKGFTDVLINDFEGNLAECSGANLFLVIDGAIHTPTADRFLNGITRQTVMQLAQDMGINVIERRIKPEELDHAQEVFVTGSAAEVTPIGRIDERHYDVGPITKKLMDAYSALVHG
ncbi:MAG: branched-chain amino acid aminotransferase [Alphaproteobacteria bacterium]|nr:branched-chain amino acid aminotransferase [Alphaproteobacteria bacterium]